MLIKFPPSLSDYQERGLQSHITEWCLSNGVMFSCGDLPGHGHSVPVTLYPTPFSRHGFEMARQVQSAFNSLYFSVVMHPEFLVDELKRAAGSTDDFTLKLLEIFEQTRNTRTQRLTGGLFRSDYLVDRARTSVDEGRQIKQVEFNTISVSFGALSTKVTELHKFMAATAKSSVHGEVPISTSLHDLTEGLAAMHKAYDSLDSQTIVLIVSQPDEANICDQRLIEFELFRSHQIVCVRCTLEQISRKTIIGENNRLIFVPLGAEVSVCYYRSGYSPSDYPSENEWDARLRMESSHAIQCPSVLTQLAGTKKIQQLLTQPEVLSRLNPRLSDEQLESVQKTFVEIWPLDESERGLQGRKIAMTTPERYVLKPQREGGGNNIYKEEITSFLDSVDPSSWSNYILMELIEPPKISNKLLKNGKVMGGRVVSELGVFGTALWDLDNGIELVNKEAGFLLRTKLQSSNEGGIASGFGCLDAVQLR